MNKSYAENLSDYVIKDMENSYLEYLKDNNTLLGEETNYQIREWLRLRKEGKY